MEERDNNPVVSFAAYESMSAMYERFVKRLLIALLITIIFLFASNIAWLHFFSQFEYAEDSYSDIYTQDGFGNNNINTGEQGVIRFGPDLQENIPQEDDDTPKQ